MKILIDISEKDYHSVMYDHHVPYGVVYAITNGTPVHPNGNWTRRHYVYGDKTLDMWVCSHCGEEFSYDAETGASIYDYDYCPNCGDYKRNRAEGGIE